jgi:hypothetical protein
MAEERHVSPSPAGQRPWNRDCGSARKTLEPSTSIIRALNRTTARPCHLAIDSKLAPATWSTRLTTFAQEQRYGMNNDRSKKTGR